MIEKGLYFNNTRELRQSACNTDVENPIRPLTNMEHRRRRFLFCYNFVSRWRVSACGSERIHLASAVCDVGCCAHSLVSRRCLVGACCCC
jgi:hypothetical protein